MKVYSPNDVFIAKRNQDSSSFEEHVLVSGPNKVVYFDSASSLVALNPLELTVGSSSYFSGSISNAVSSNTSISSSHALIANSASYVLNSKNSISASYALNSTIAESSSFATSAVSASYALNAGSGGTLIQTGSNYPITSSWSNNSVSSSHSLISVSSSYALNSNEGSSLITGSTYPITSSWSNNSQTASYISGSITLSGTSGYYGKYFEGSLSSTSSIFEDSNGITISVPLRATSSLAISASYAPGSPSISSSYSTTALSASYAPFTQIYQLNTLSASWASSSLSSSYVTGSILFNKNVQYQLTSSWALSASYSRLFSIVNNANFSSPFASDGTLYDYFRITLTDNIILSNPTPRYDGQRLTWELIQDGVGNRNMVLDTSFLTGSDLGVVQLNKTGSKRDFMTAIYNSVTTNWYIIEFFKGY